MGTSNYITCTQCNRKIINYSGQFCRNQFLSTSQSSGNNKLDKFIKETQKKSKYCDDFIEWIPRSILENIKYLADGGNSKVFFGTWNLSLNMSLTSSSNIASVSPRNIALASSSNIALKAIRDSNSVNDLILNEFKIHHKCRNPRVIPFYGITKSPEGNDYAMVVKHAEHGDLRNYIRKFFSKLTWTNRAKILIEISKALNSIHQKNLVHKDFHCKNILVDKDDKVFISDFGLCQPIDSETVSDKIQGVLPYIAPEVLRCKPYTKQSEVYSISMIMWELTSKKPPFSNYHHNAELALSVLDGLRPDIVKGTPDFYVNIMERCWNPEPSGRPDASLLPKLFEEMMESCKIVDNNKDYNLVSPHHSNSNSVISGSTQEYMTVAYDYTLREEREEYCR
ncbi:Cmk2p [Rhizophagus irregularis DAOM 197198w]|uniref:Cmk2p n=3 Tax=Rhizophagus irregularis TaxID=588596 RepID=A0A015L466_RHIIW|nr:Cmk2p [Rhizophagus irregularis DAOM 197198w]